MIVDEWMIVINSKSVQGPDLVVSHSGKVGGTEI